MLATRKSSLCVLLSVGLLACGDDDSSGGSGETDPTGGTSATSGASTGSGTGSVPTSGSSGGGETMSSGPVETESDGSTSGTGPGDGSSSSGGTPFPVDCDDGGLPVRVEGAEYATVGEGVIATPPGSTLFICPGDYEEAASISIERDLTIFGAGSGAVTINAGKGLDRVFLVRNASVTFEGISIVGGGFGIDVGYEENERRVTVMRDVRVAQSRQAGIFIFGSMVDFGNAQAVFENVVVEGVAADGEPPAIGGVALYNIEATFVDTAIRDNVTRSGGFEVQDSQVDFQGGQVVRNEALFPNGGGVRLLTETTARPFTIGESDWGASAEEENTPNDMDCGAGATNDVGWLGNPANAVCGTDVEGCCMPK